MTRSDRESKAAVGRPALALGSQAGGLTALGERDAEAELADMLPELPEVTSRAKTVSWTGWMLLGCWILLETAAQIGFKLGASAAGTGLSELETIGEAAGNGWSIFAYVCTALEFPIWLAVLARLDLSLAFPLSSLSQVTILIASLYVLGEHAGWMHVLGIGSILIGTLLILGEADK